MEPQQLPQLPDEVQIPYGQDVSAFANVVFVYKPTEMVYIDFVQVDVAVTSGPGHASAVARVVIHPKLAATLADNLSKQLAASEGD